MQPNSHLWVIVLLALAPALSQAVTCVSNLPASNPDSAYADQGDGTVTDTRTGLQWKRCAEGQSWTGATCTGSATTHTWPQALTLAAAASDAGHGDWRLPNLKELGSLVEECRSNPSINDAVFPNTPGSDFWSGSPVAGHSSDAWYVYFDYGTAYYYLRSATYHVRLVRAGQ